MSNAERWTTACAAPEPVGEAVSEPVGNDLAALYDAYAATLYRYALSIVGSEEAAQDVLQEVFVGVLRRARKGRIERPREYLLRATRNQAYLHLRKRRRCACEVAMDTWVEVTAAEFEQRELAADLSAALGRLPVEQREVITLHVAGDLSFREIAAVLGVPLPTATSRYRLALTKLRVYLSESDEHA